MTVPTNTLTTTAATTAQTIREDLSDIVSMISPVESAVYDSLGNTSNTVKNTKHEWLLDTLRAPADNAAVDSDDDTNEAITLPTRLYNMHQIQKIAFSIGGSVEVSDSPENVNSLAYQTTKKTQELMGDMERACLRGVRNDGGASTPRQMRGILNWLTTNIDRAGDSTLNADGTISGGTARDLTMNMIKNVRQNIFVQGGSPKIAYCSPFQKRRVTSFTETGNYRTVVEGKKVESTIDIFVDEFGKLVIEPHKTIDNDVFLILDTSRFKKATYRKLHRYARGKTGDSDPYTLLAEWTIESSAEAASGRITNLTTT